MFVIVTVAVRPEKSLEWQALIAHHAAGSRQEPGCLRFDVLTGQGGRFTLVEEWTGAEALEAHRQTAHYRRWRREVPGIQAGERTHEEFEAGGEGLGKTQDALWARAVRRAATHRGQTLAFTNGCFDVLHAGHVQCLLEARRQGDVLVVGVNTDASVRLLKGEGRPACPLAVRAAALAQLPCVDYVIPFDGPTPLPLIEDLRPDVLVKGADYSREMVVGGEFVESYGGRVHLAEVRPGYSTTLALESCRA